MKVKTSMFCLLLVALFSGCGIFRKGCHCPKVSYTVPSKTQISRNV